MNYSEEYFCPNCGAILNDQPGFDPDLGSWKCTECGELLMDEDVYEGDTFEGVAWYCDNCGALLNRQSGFSDSYGSWTCTECGYVNGTTEDDIINSDEAKYICPRCGTALDNQSFFNRFDDEWICTECGAHLRHEYFDAEYEEVTESQHRCPNCDATLDKQWNYSEYLNNWICTECGAHLYHSYSDAEYEEVTESQHRCPNCDALLENQDGFEENYEDFYCEECGAHLIHDYSIDEYIVQKKDNNTYDKNVSINKERSAADNSSNDSRRILAYSNSSVNLKFFEESNIRAQATTGSASGKPRSKKKTLKVLCIVFGVIIGTYILGSVFTDLFPHYNEENHSNEVKLLYSSNSYIDENYYDAIMKLKSQDLYDIRLFPMEDLKTGLISKEGSIDKIEINGVSDFQAGSWVNRDSVISISFHSFKKKEITEYKAETNTHVTLNRIDISIPAYYIEESEDEVSSNFQTDKDDETKLFVLFDERVQFRNKPSIFENMRLCTH